MKLSKTRDSSFRGLCFDGSDGIYGNDGFRQQLNHSTRRLQRVPHSASVQQKQLRRIVNNSMNARWLKLRQLAEYLIFRMAIGVLQALSPRQTKRLARALAFLVHRCLPRKWTRYEVARSNLRAAFGDRYTDAERDRMIFGMWVHLFRMVAEIVQMPRKLRLDNCDEVIRFHQRDETVRLLSTGRPVIVLGGHFGNWEVATATFGFFGFPMGVVARDLDNPYLHEWFRRFRQHTGHRLVSKKGGYDVMLVLLLRRGLLGLLADQDAGPRGLFVDFFGRPASTFKSIALLALEHRAYICVGYAVRLPDDFEHNFWVRYELGTAAMIDPLAVAADNPVQEITQQFTAALERIVRRHPEQYFWLHRRWKSAPGQGRRKRAA
jgi:KDO2-lipid IV(A) lauroyltransferase